VVAALGDARGTVGAAGQGCGGTGERPPRLPFPARAGAVQWGKGSFTSRRQRWPLKATRGSENERGQRGQGKDHGGTAAGTAGSSKDHSKFEMPIYTKVVSLNKMDNFHNGRM
jgi:hypothetical protein